MNPLTPADHQPGGAPHQRSDERSHWQILELMFSQQVTASLAALINFAVLSIVFRSDISPWLLAIWLAFYLGVVYVRVTTSSGFANIQRRQDHEIKPWLRRVDGLQLTTGLLWGSLLGYLTLIANTTQLVLVCMIMVGLVSGGLLTYSYRQTAYFLFAATTSLPVFVCLLLRPQPLWAPAFITAFGFVSLCILSGRFARFHMHAVELSLTNQDMAGHLEQKNAQVTDLNQALEEKVEELGEANNLLVAEQKRIVGIANKLESLSSTDALTGIPNRRQFEQVLERDWGWAKRGQRDAGLILLDIDHFKAYNDHYGHQQGDHCLIRVASILADTVDPEATVARYGGEEFAVLIPNAVYSEVLGLGQRLVAAVAAAELPHEASPTASIVTISAGLAVIRPAADLHPQHLIGNADQALYEAKARGRNQLVTDRADGVLGEDQVRPVQLADNWTQSDGDT